MASIKANVGRQSESSTNGGASYSIVGGVIAPRPEPSSARARAVVVSKDALRVELVDGRTVTVPLSWFPRLIEASPRERKEYELIGDGVMIHWPAVDEHIDVPNLLRS
jgi:hypothetical protein